MWRRSLYWLLLFAMIPFVVQYTHALIATNYMWAAAGGLLLPVLWFRRDGGSNAAAPRGLLVVHLVIAAVTMVVAWRSDCPQIAMFGVVAWLHGVLWSRQDRDYQISLGYLATLPLFCIQLPPLLDRWVTGRMNAASTRFASWLLDHLDILHLRTVDGIEIAGRKFLMTDVCDGPASIPVFLACAAALLSLLRRGWLHVIPAMFCAAWLAVFMNTAKLVWMAWGWHESGTLVGQTATWCAFCGMLGLFVSFEFMLGCLFGKIPLWNEHGEMAKRYGNIFTVAWDRRVMLVPRSHRAGSTIAETPTVRDVIRGKPEVTERLIVRWFLEFVEAWSETRSWWKMLLGVPFIVAVCWTGWVWSNLETDVSNRYVNAAVSALDNDNTTPSVFILKRLLQQGTADYELQHRFAVQVTEEGGASVAQPWIKRLTSPDIRGHVPTRIWLAQQSLDANPMIRLNHHQRLEQLGRAVLESSGDVEAHRLLAEEHLRAEEFLAAEQHYREAMQQQSEYAVALVPVMSQLGRSRAEIDTACKDAIMDLDVRLRQDPSDFEARRARAQLHAMFGDFAAAEACLQEGLEKHDTRVLREALASLYLVNPDSQQDRSIHLNLSERRLVKALQMDPVNASAAEALFRRLNTERHVAYRQLRDAIEHHENQSESRELAPEEVQTLVYLYGACGLYEKAIPLLTRLGEETPRRQLDVARFCELAGRQDEAKRTLETLEQQMRGQLDGSPADTDLLQLLADTLLVQERYRDVVTVLEQQARKSNADLSPQLLMLQSTCLVKDYEVRMNADPLFAESPEALEQLRTALELNPRDELILKYLAELCYRDSGIKDAASTYMTTLLANPFLTARCYLWLGTQAILHEDYDGAVTNLRRADSLLTSNPMVLTNLSVALVRQSEESAVEALRLVEEALSLSPGHPDILVVRAEVYMAMERWADASDDLQAILKQLPEHREANELTKRLPGTS